MSKHLQGVFHRSGPLGLCLKRRRCRVSACCFAVAGRCIHDGIPS